MTAASPFRRIAGGTWSDPRDPTIYASFRLRAEPALAYLEAARQRTGIRVTLTHLVIKAAGEALRACPEANAIVRFRRACQRDSADVSVLVLCGEPGRRDLASAKICRAGEKDPASIARELRERVEAIRSGTEPLERARRSLARTPRFLMRAVLRLASFFTSSLRISLSRPGLQPEPFGAAVVTSAGSLGLERMWAPLVSWSKAAFVLAPGKVVDEAVVEEGRVVAGKVMWIGAAFDHRLVDGIHVAEIGEALRRVLEDPFSSLPALPAADRAS